MGLFSNKKDLCPICGSPTPRLFPTKIEGEAICKECAAKIDLPAGMTDTMTLEEFRVYLTAYEENAVLRARFHKDYAFDVDGWSDELQIDFSHGLFRFTSRDSSTVFEAPALTCFRILEDDRPIYEGDASGLRCYESEVPARVDQLQPYFDRYLMEKHEYDRMKRMEEMMDRGDGDRPRRFIPEPRFDPALPVEHFRVQVELDHPYWPQFQGELDGPRFSTFTPDLMDYIRDYEKQANSIYELARNLMALSFPDAPEINAAQEAQAAAVVTPTVVVAAPAPDPVAEIQKYKTLLDAGIITEEEFTAKKRQLMGI